MNWADSHLVNRRCSEEMYKIEGFYREKEGGLDEEVKRVDYFRQGHLPLGESKRSYQADHLTSADLDIPE